jgi:hypothetical protein
MNNDLNSFPETKRPTLDSRLAQNPQLRERLHALIDVIDAAAGDCVTAAQAEARVVQEIRRIGSEALAAWSQHAESQAQAQVPAQHPSAVRDGKKNSTGIRSSAKSK